MLIIINNNYREIETEIKRDSVCGGRGVERGIRENCRKCFTQANMRESFGQG
jgi:hypothetical protein